MDQVTTAYNVKTPIFEGPLDLLLDLIQNRKLFINELSLAQVTDDYIGYVKNLPEMNITHTTSFILIAATLILIKSKSLLPNLELTGDEEEKIVDLEKRLKLYQLIKDASEGIKNTFGKNIIFQSPEKSYDDPLFSPDPKINLENMHLLLQNLIERLPKKQFMPEVSVQKVMSIEEMIESLTERIQTSLNTSFRDFTNSVSGGTGTPKEKKVYVIVGFLAMLELVREGIINVLQDNHFEDITIHKEDVREESPLTLEN